MVLIPLGNWVLAVMSIELVGVNNEHVIIKALLQLSDPVGDGMLPV